MGHIDELIAEMCPNGIKYKLFYEVAQYIRGVTYSKDKEVNDGIGGTKLLRANNIDLQGNRLDFTDVKVISKDVKIKESQWLKQNDILICAGSGSKEHIGIVAYISQDLKSTFGGFMGVIRVDESMILPRYLFHIMVSPIFKEHLTRVSNSSTINNINNDTWARFEIPVPPIEIQQEIVAVLDCFTELEDKLNDELMDRRKQYQHYLDAYFDGQTENLMQLSELGLLQRGKRFVHADAVESGGVACIHYGELYTYYRVYAKTVRSRIREELRSKMRYAHKGDVIIVGAGENNIDIGVGVAWDGDEDVAVHDACYTLVHNQNPKYISYYLRSSGYHNQIKKYVSEGKICSISAEGIGRAIIPIPSVEEQNRIVAELDVFEKICNDNQYGLPAEILLRKKQYEYYREKLLAFRKDVN